MKGGILAMTSISFSPVQPAMRGKTHGKPIPMNITPQSPLLYRNLINQMIDENFEDLTENMATHRFLRATASDSSMNCDILYTENRILWPDILAHVRTLTSAPGFYPNYIGVCIPVNTHQMHDFYLDYMSSYEKDLVKFTKKHVYHVTSDNKVTSTYVSPDIKKDVQFCYTITSRDHHKTKMDELLMIGIYGDKAYIEESKASIVDDRIIRDPMLLFIHPSAISWS